MICISLHSLQCCNLFCNVLKRYFLHTVVNKCVAAEWKKCASAEDAEKVRQWQNWVTVFINNQNKRKTNVLWYVRHGIVPNVFIVKTLHDTHAIALPLPYIIISPVLLCCCGKNAQILVLSLRPSPLK